MAAHTSHKEKEKIMGGIMGGAPKPPKPPKPPAPVLPPPEPDKASAGIYSDARRRAMASASRDILTSSQGLTAAADTAKKTLLGA
jgi:hypothetical protein